MASVKQITLSCILSTKHVTNVPSCIYLRGYSIFMMSALSKCFIFLSLWQPLLYPQHTKYGGRGDTPLHTKYGRVYTVFRLSIRLSVCNIFVSTQYVGKILVDFDQILHMR